MPAALISIAGGVGDLVRATPLVGVCAMRGFDVDLLVETDFDDAAALVRDGRDVRRVYTVRSRWTGAGVTDLAALGGERYAVAIATALATIPPAVRADRVLRFDRAQWLRDGDAACMRSLGRALGCDAPLPPPFVVPSARQFDLPADTVALHPGCKSNWPWKKWHGFADLARRLPHVVIVGMPSDLDNTRTYFGSAFDWPAHVRSFVGHLDLPDTAALLSACAMLVSNDSGLMHVAAALGIPTFGIFGITSPERELVPLRNLTPITKGLPCEAACRRARWGRTDCDRHLECLRSLTADEVFARVDAARLQDCHG
ncbi:MAG TPA: glycosyltransferase family 9 protein [Vicinamibacterales bacterium]|nr:glycosyltransferase family 9 protein [Vicinamibacterales bacterium]